MSVRFCRGAACIELRGLDHLINRIEIVGLEPLEFLLAYRQVTIEGVSDSPEEYSRSSCLTISTRTAISRLPSIQNAQVASHRFPSKAACGRTLSSRRVCKIGLSSPSCTRAIATASCRSLSWFTQTSTAACRLPARRKNEAAYSVDHGQPNSFQALIAKYTKAVST